MWWLRRELDISHDGSGGVYVNGALSSGVVKLSTMFPRCMKPVADMVCLQFVRMDLLCDYVFMKVFEMG